MTTIASLLLTTAPGAMLPGAAAPAPGAGGAVGDFLKLVLPGCGDGIAAGVARDPARQDLAGPGTGLPLVDADLANGDAALAWLADATGVTVPPPPTPAVVPEIAALPPALRPDSRPEPRSDLRPDLGLRIVPAHTPVATPAAALEADAPIVAAEEEELAAPSPRDVATDAAPPAPPAAIMPPLPVAMSAAPAEAHPAAEAPTTKRGIEATASSPIVTPSASPEAAVQDEAPSPPDVAQTPAARKEAQALPSGSDLPAPPSAPIPPQPATASAPPAPSSEPTTTVAPVRATTRPEKPDLARTGAPAPGASSATDTPSNIVPPPPVATQRARVAGATPVEGVTAVPDAVKPSPAAPVEAAPAAPTRAGTRPTIVLAPATGAAAVSQAAAPVAPERSIAMAPDPVAGLAAPAPASTSPRRADPDTIATAPATATMAPSILDTPLSTTPRPITPAPVMATAAAALRVDAPLTTTPSQPIDMATPPSAPASDTPVIAAAAALRVDTPLPVAPAPAAATTIPASPATPTTAPAPAPATAAIPRVDTPPPIASAPPAAPSATATQETSPLTPPPTEAPAAPADTAPVRAPTRAVAPPPASAESPAPVIAPVIASAARTFAEAIHRAVIADDRARPADAIGQPQATAAISAAAVASTGQAQQQTLDMRQPQWPGAMIQHIEKLRDMADANDMRIRVVPDALGTIDVALHREGDTVQVQLTAEQPQTRALLAEAQPRLTEMAEARGLKLQHGATSGGAPNPQGDRQPQQQQRSAPLPAAPVSARRGGAAGTDDTEQRLA